MNVAFLLVTCCLERSRAEILSRVLTNLQEQAPELRDTLTVFDNASTVAETIGSLKACYTNVYQANTNVGYWTAIDWWLTSLQPNPPKYTYIIESDMIHYDFNRLWACEAFLDAHPDVGSCRLLEYSVANMHLYNKDAPVLGSRISAWQSHTNKVTGKHIILGAAEHGIWTTNFLTQLCALNRYDAMLRSFQELKKVSRFTELDFQALYWNQHQSTAILDGGIFHGELSVDRDLNKAIGSWTSAEEMRRMGYFATRFASISPHDKYTVQKV